MITETSAMLRAHPIFLPIVILIASCIATGVSVAQPSDSPNPPADDTSNRGPRLLFVEGNPFDFGEVGPGRHDDTISLANIGDDTLRIYDVRSSCGCLVGSQLRNTVAPGDTVRWLAVSYIVYRGRSEKTFLVVSNDSSADSGGRQMLRIKAMCTVDYVWRVNDAADVRWVCFKRVNSESHEKISLQLEATGDEPVTFRLGVVEAGPGWSIDVPRLEKEMTINPGETAEIPIIVATTDGGSGPRSGTITIRTSSPLQPELRLRCYAPPGRRAAVDN